MYICAGNNENFDFAIPMGVGLVDIAINLTKAIMIHKPDEVTFVGTAGSYGKLKPLQIVESKVSTQIELSFLEKKSYTPINNLLTAKNINKNEKKIVVNSSNYITTDEILGKKFIDLGIDIENMEYYSVLSVAKNFNISVKGIFIVTNYTNKNAHQDFLKNSEIAKKLLTEYVEKNELNFKK